MDMLADLLRVLPWPDWLALALFFAGWVGYARFARARSTVQPSLLALTNRERRRWMLQTTLRDNRVIDRVVVQNLSTSPSFFASTTILIIGGLLAVLCAARTSLLVFDLKVVLLTSIFVYAFFGFTWSLRQYSFGAILVAAAPEHRQFEDEAARQAFADRAGRVVGLAAETFNDGLRAYYMAFAVCAWFLSPWVFVAATAGVVFILYQREFRSDVLAVLRDD
jgi:uncharacterized membrane protein